MLSRLIVKNFKSIGEPGVDLELKPLTILVGPNGSGKSSIFEAVAF
ncbi:MAG: AAA family ATPase, partial [Dehalococcoidia bacterium]